MIKILSIKQGVFMSQNLVTVTRIDNEDERITFLPKYLSNDFLLFEQNIYRWMDNHANHYQGGMYHFYKLSNGGFYIAPEESYVISIPQNYFKEKLTANACGIVASLYILNALSHYFYEKRNNEKVELLNNYYYALRDFALAHPEANLILSAID